MKKVIIACSLLWIWLWGGTFAALGQTIDTSDAYVTTVRLPQGKKRIVFRGERVILRVIPREGNSLQVVARLVYKGKKEVPEPYRVSWGLKAEPRPYGAAVETVFGGLPRGKARQRLRIQVELHVPPDADLQINTHIGSIEIQETSGNLILETELTNVAIGYARGEENLIKGDFNRFDIKFIRSARTDTDFSTFRIDLSFDLELKGDYNTFNLRRAKRVKLAGDFTSIRAGRIYTFQASGDNLNLSMDRIYYLDTKGDFQTLSVGELPPNFHYLRSRGDYGNVRIDNPLQTPYKFFIRLEHGTLQADGVEFIKREESFAEKYYEGYYRDPHAHAEIHVDRDFGTVILNN
ncbi:MAG: hypothetical protein GXO27_00570 [Chlorobi bacterium]|nr:hypothetical protein [Chlorobiota bacterium]